MNYKTLTNKELQNLCRERQLPVSGKKEVLINRLTGKEVARPKKRSKKGSKKGSKKSSSVQRNTKEVLKRLQENQMLYKFIRNGDGFYSWEGWIFDEIKQVVNLRVVGGRRRQLTLDDLKEAKELNLPVDLSMV